MIKSEIFQKTFHTKNGLIIFVFFFIYLVPFINVYLLDTVTGSLKLSHTHKRVKPPVHVVLAENWIIVSLYSC